MSNEPEIVSIEDLREGDRVRVTFEGEWPKSGVYVRLPDGGLLGVQQATTIHRLPPKPRPLEVGETVKYARREHDYTVKGIYQDEVWIGRELDTIICAPDVLKRPDGTPIEVAP